MAKLEVNELAQTDLIGIKLYLKNNFAENAYNNFRTKLQKLFETLKTFPLMGTEVKAPKYQDFRFCIIQKYYIFYRYQNDTVKIEAVLHMARQYKNILKNLT